MNRTAINSVATITLGLAMALAPGVQARTYSVLHTFTNSPDGALPGPLIMGSQGNLYGTSRGGGPGCEGVATCGTVFEVTTSGTETILHTFQGGADGAYPLAPLAQDASGNLYGTTEGNGALGATSTVFEVDLQGNETVLYDFNGPQGGSQDSPVVLDAAGNLYGMSPYSGDYNCGINGLGCGNLYKLTQAGKFTVLHKFKGTDGIKPEGGLVLKGKDAYGSTLLGGDMSCEAGFGRSGCGTLFRLDGRGKLEVLHTFSGGSDGASPLGVIGDAKGNLYGIAEYGGDVSCYVPYGCGTVFELTTQGQFEVLHTFTEKNTPEPLFASHLIRDAKGNLYGVNQIGGANFSGFIFKVSPRGKYTNLFSFPSTADVPAGNRPQSISMDSLGNFYGAMLTNGQINENLCGAQGCGTIFKVAE